MDNSEKSISEQKAIYLKLYSLYRKLSEELDLFYLQKSLSSLSNFEFNTYYSQAEEFNTLLKKFNPSLIKFKPEKKQAIKNMISNWYDDAPAFSRDLLRGRYNSVYKASKRTLGEMLKQIINLNDCSDVDRKISSSLDNIFNGMTSDDPANGYEVVGKQFLEKFATGTITKQNLKNLYNRYNLSSLTEGRAHNKFWNPFDTDELNSKASSEAQPKEERHITKIEALDFKQNKNQVCYKNGKMYAAKSFWPGEVIEEDPVKILSNHDMYSRNVREMAFELVANREYGIPIGYSTLYRRSDETSREPNAKYEYDKKNEQIIIKASAKIPEGNEIILKADKMDFSNKYKDDTFKMDNGSYGDFMSIKRT